MENLRTWDNGKNWYQVKFSDDGSMKIINNIENLYPGLLAEEKLSQSKNEYELYKNLNNISKR